MYEIITALFLTFAIAYTDIYYVEPPQQFLSPVAKAGEKTPLDYETEKIQAYLEEYNSPLSDYARTFLEVSYQYNLEPSLLVAIAGVESSFGKHTPSCADFNPFGWSSTTSPCGFYRFKDFGEAIQFVGYKIATSPYYSNFREEGTIEALAENYNNGEEKWIKNMKWFMDEI